jgi:excisionase family DNA binding protein
MTRLLTIEQAADRLSVSVHTLRLWRHKGYGPQGATLGRRVMFRESDVEQWIEQQFGVARKGA